MQDEPVRQQEKEKRVLRMSDARVESFVAEDVPYVDLTCACLLYTSRCV